MDAFRDYRLPFKTRFLLFFMALFRHKGDHLPTPGELHRSRMTMPRFFLVNWILGNPDKRTRSEDRMIPVRDAEIPVRVYKRKLSTGKIKPLIMNFHGGGWAVGNLQNNDFYCAYLAAELDAVVVSVDYRLAPEHKFPAAIHDCYDALCWAVEAADELGADKGQVVVTGDSAGGNLSAAVCLMTRDLKGPEIHLQALIYPAVDASLTNPSISRHAFAPVLTKRDMEIFLELYAREEADKQNPYLSPWCAVSLYGLPPAVVLTAGYDPLQDDGRLWVERLQGEGISAEWLHFPEDVHGCVSLPFFTRSGWKANVAMKDAIRRRLNEVVISRLVK